MGESGEQDGEPSRKIQGSRVYAMKGGRHPTRGMGRRAVPSLAGVLAPEESQTREEKRARGGRKTRAEAQ